MDYTEASQLTRRFRFRAKVTILSLLNAIDEQVQDPSSESVAYTPQVLEVEVQSLLKKKRRGWAASLVGLLYGGKSQEGYVRI